MLFEHQIIDTLDDIVCIYLYLSIFFFIYTHIKNIPQDKEDIIYHSNYDV